MSEYSQYVGAKYDPLSMSEIIAAPLYKQKQYDALEEARVKQAEMFKINPLDVHTERAKKLNGEYMSKVDELANYQTKTGDIQGSKSKFLDLQKEYKKLNDPMGEVSKINNAYTAEATEKTRFLEAAAKQYGSTQALNLWNQHRKNYTGVNDKGEIINIDPKGIVANQDFMKDVQEHNKLLGETTSNIAGSGYKIEKRPEGLVMVNSSGQIQKNSNLDQVNSMRKALSAKWQDKTGEGYLFNQEAGKNQDDFNQYFKNTIDSQFKTGIKKDSNTSASFIGGGDGSGRDSKSMFNDAIQDPNSIKNLNKDTGEVDFEKIGTLRDNRDIIGYDETTHAPIYGNSVKVKSTYKDVLTPIQQKFYETAAKRLIKAGRLPQNADLSNTVNAEKIGFYMKNHMKFPTIASDIIRADVAIDNKLFSGNLASKDASSRNRVLTQDLRQTEDGAPLRTMIDVETGKKIKFESGDKVDYLGVESPINYSNYGFENKFEQSVMGHRAQILDKDGNIKANVVISRTPNEMKDPTFKKMYDINQTYKNGLNKLGEWVRPTGKYSGSKELAKTKVKVNEDNTFQIQIDGYGESPRMNNEQFIQQMQSIMEY